jgi:hypothetical protein
MARQPYESQGLPADTDNFACRKSEMNDNIVLKQYNI